MEQDFYNNLKHKEVLDAFKELKLFEPWEFEYEITELYIHSMIHHKDAYNFEIYDICMN